MTIEFHDVGYAYRRWRPRVLLGLDYTLANGFTVLLGPNGAGKSTLLALAAGATRPSAGTVRLGRLRSTSRTYRGAVAWMPQRITAMTGMTCREQVAYTGWLKGMNRADAWRSAANALDRVRLGDQAGQRVNRLSGGQLRRLGVASALVHNATVLLLDEPTAGLDPAQRRVFRDLIRSLATDRVTVLMSTHDVADLSEEADRVAVITDGTIVFDGPVHDFLAHAGPGTPEGRLAESAYTVVTSR